MPHFELKFCIAAKSCQMVARVCMAQHVGLPVQETRFLVQPRPMYAPIFGAYLCVAIVVGGAFTLCVAIRC